MRVEVEPGSYVVAVSGGVDSVTLLHVLHELQQQARPGLYQFTVAHFDHGIRTDSDLDRLLVHSHAQKYKMPFVYAKGNLGPGTSEAEARAARYNFLRNVQQAAAARAIMTAHHQDDLVETGIINLIRGTNRRGLSSLKDHRHLRRPLLAVPKRDLIAYAQDQGLTWREDSTNKDNTLLRNYIRNVLLPKIGPEGKQQLLQNMNHLAVLNRAIDSDLMVYLHTQPSRQTLNRHKFIELPHSVAKEVMAAWLRSHGISNFDSKLLEKFVIAAKSYLPGKQIDIDMNHRLLIGSEGIVLINKY